MAWGREDLLRFGAATCRHPGGVHVGLFFFRFDKGFRLARLRDRPEQATQLTGCHVSRLGVALLGSPGGKTEQRASKNQSHHEGTHDRGHSQSCLALSRKMPSKEV
jgi:hypothetical protein